jgi:hypothetical protein
VPEVGGGDFKRGDTGQWGVLSPEFVPGILEGLGTLEGSWVEEGAGGSCMLAAERARWMDAALGTVLPAPA